MYAYVLLEDKIQSWPKILAQ